MVEISKGAKMALGLLGITPEMLANPALLLAKFGINPDDVIKLFAEYRQIGLNISNGLAENNMRLARIEARLGIETPGNDPGERRNGAADHAGEPAELRNLDTKPRH